MLLACIGLVTLLHGAVSQTVYDDPYRGESAGVGPARPGSIRASLSYTDPPTTVDDDLCRYERELLYE